MILFLANLWGWIIAHWRLLLYIAAGVILVIGIALVFRACGKSSAKIDLETVDKINSKNEAEAKKEVREMVEDNLNVATTVDNRTTLAEANAVERDRLIEEKIKEVDKKIQEAKANGGNVTQEDLECILVPANCP